MSRKVAILIFPDVELLDFAGPYEVFTSTSSVITGEAPFEVYTVGETGATIRTRYGLQVTPDYAAAACPPPDILVVPGGRGTREVIRNAALVEWVRQTDGRTTLTTSVCTGALVLGATGLLDGLQATTHHSAYEELSAIAPKASVVRGVRFVDNGRIITSAGVQAGMDMALHVVARLHGDEVAQQTASHIDYRWSPQKE